MDNNHGAASLVRSDALLAEDSQFRCTVCGQVGTVGRCCGLDTRDPLNDLARAELASEEQRKPNKRNELTLGAALEAGESARAVYAKLHELAKRVCRWIRSANGYTTTECGYIVQSNERRACPYCGGKIIEWVRT